MIPFNGWTVFKIVDGTTEVRIDCISVKTGISNAITFLPVPKSPASQPISLDPEVISLDLKRVTHSLSVMGYIVDDSDNPPNGKTVPEKKQQLLYMMERRKGPFSVTYRGETYSDNIFMSKLNFDDSEDTYVRSGSSLITVDRLTKLKVTMDLVRATRRS
jgi:hypothetical protein